MIHSHLPKVNQLEAGWYVIYDNGEVATERETSWKKLKNKKDIRIMGLKWRNKHFELADKAPYVPPGETHAREVTMSPKKVKVSKPSIVGRYIGYYGDKEKVITRVDLQTGEFVTEKLPYV